MWLRDALPWDLKGAQVWICGYDTKLMNSTSFQDLEALASNFRRVRVSSRTQHSVRVLFIREAIAVLVSSDMLQKETSRPRPGVFIAHSLDGVILKEVSIFPASHVSAKPIGIY